MHVRSKGFIKQLRRWDHRPSMSPAKWGDLPFSTIKKDLITLLVMEKKKKKKNLAIMHA